MIIGKKNKPDLYNNLIGDHIPDNIVTYVEPFGGSFSLPNFFKNRPETTIYNDINQYDLKINADEIYNEDFEYFIEKVDSPDTFFYIDPPYYGKEQYYNLENKDVCFHKRLFESVEKIEGDFIISYDDCRFIRNLYRNYDIYSYRGDRKKHLQEIIIKRHGR